MTTALSLLVLTAPLAFLGVAALAVSERGTTPTRVENLGTIASWFGVAVAAAAGIAVAFEGLLESPTWGWNGLGFSIRLDALSTVMLVMITLLAVVIFRFSRSYLDGDPRHGAFLGWLAATIAAVETLVLAGNLFLLVIAWIATSLSLHQLLLFYRDRRGAVVAGRKKFIAARIGDGFLIAACVLLVSRFDTGNLQQIFDQAPGATGSGWALGAVELAALCMATAALLKSAQFPTHGWLVEVMETPTPVSALLHAGILNAGPFLVMRMAFVMDGAAMATTLLILAGGFTALFASVVLLTQPSVKVALGYSSAAHMGFMLMVCGLGVYPAALLHLVAHSFYKAHAFLSSGSAVEEARARKVALPRRLGSGSRAVASLAVAMALYVPLALLWGIDFGDDAILLLIGAILVMGTTQLIAPALDSDGPTAGTGRAVLLALGVTTAFFALETGTYEMLFSTVPHDGARSAIHYGATALVLTAFATVVALQILEPARRPSRFRRTLAIHLRNGLYANAAFDRAVGALRPQTTGAARS